MNSDLNQLIIVLVFTLTFFSCANNRTEQAEVKFPTTVYLEKLSPDKKTKAIIYSWINSNESNILGSEYRYILGFSKSKSKWYIDYELSEGFGTYEGGILGIRWLNNNEVLIKRTIADSRKDIKYNLLLNTWTLVD